MLDFLRAIFPVAVAVAFPPAGLLLAIASYADGAREDAIRLAAAALLGACVYALALT